MTTTAPDVTERAPPDEGRAAARVGSGIFISRVFGFVRERVFAHYFGSSVYAEAWFAAARLPNVVQNLLGEGTLSASLIPVYSEFLEEGREEEAARFAGAALGILAVVAAAAALLGIALAPILVELFFPRWSPDTRELTVLLVRIVFPMAGVLVISAWALGILNSHRRFFVSYLAPAFRNVAMITAMVGGFVYFGIAGGDLVIALAWGALVGGLLQLGWKIPFAIPYLRGMRVSLGRGVEGVREAIQSFVPVVAARGVVSLSGWIDLILAGRLTPGAVAVMGYAQTFYMLPISLFGMSVAASELPEMSRMRGAGERELAERVGRALRRVMYFLIPSALGYLALGDVVVGALYETGEFTETQTLVTWSVLAAYSLGIPASASSRVLSSAFYALRDTKTPARIAYLRVAISTAGGIAMMLPADRLGFDTLRLGAAGLAMGSSVGAWLEYVLLRVSLGRRVGEHGPGTRPILRMALAAALAAAAGVGFQIALPAAHPIVVALETLVPFGVVYLAVTALLGVGIQTARASRPQTPR